MWVGWWRLAGWPGQELRTSSGRPTVLQKRCHVQAGPAGQPTDPPAVAPTWNLQVVGRPPFTGANQFQLLRNIERADARVPDAIAAQLSPHCRWAGWQLDGVQGGSLGSVCHPPSIEHSAAQDLNPSALTTHTAAAPAPQAPHSLPPAAQPSGAPVF